MSFETKKNKAINNGATEFGVSSRKNKKFYVRYNGKAIHFGDSRYKDYTQHGDPVRRKSYKARASKIKNKNGQLTYKMKSAANYWAYHILW